MNYFKSIIFFIASICCCQAGFSQQVDSPYEVGTWSGFKPGAVSFTFDDGCLNQLAVALPMFNQYGYKMTLFTVINWGPNWTALQTAASNGHEIASHTMSHADFSTTTETGQNTELKNSQDAINGHIGGQHCITIAYPNCHLGNTALCNQYYMAARGCSGVVEASTPSNFMNISSIVCGTQGSVKTALDFKAKADAAVASRGWVVFLIHGIDNDGGYSPITTATLKGALDSLSSHREKYWVSTFGNISRYILERNCVSVKELSNTDSLITIQVIDTLDNVIYNYPVTIRRPLPLNWTSASISQNSKTINAQILEISSVKYVLFDAVPDSGDITIRKSELTHVSGSYNYLPSHPSIMQNYPNPFNPSTKIKYYLHTSMEISLKMYNLFGQEVESLTSGYQSAGEHDIAWQPRRLASGTYLYRLQAGPYTETKKLMFLK
jgi:peptidoglycan-N-acetylglucosamine deacetylase